MKDLIVIMGASCTKGYMTKYLNQLAEAGISAHVESIPSDPDFKLEDKLNFLKTLSIRFSEYSKIIFSDAFDVQFFGSKQQVLENIPNKVMWAAERVCYPDESVMHLIESPTPWKFANGGLCAGPPEQFIKFCHNVEKSHLYHKFKRKYDQEYLNYILAHSPQEVHIDKFTKLFYCLFNEQTALRFETRPVNNLCDTFPQFIHANGGWPFKFTGYEGSDF